jgi:hypothetical protein
MGSDSLPATYEITGAAQGHLSGASRPALRGCIGFRCGISWKTPSTCCWLIRNIFAPCLAEKPIKKIANGWLS